jgi:hypothetical protein
MNTDPATMPANQRRIWMKKRSVIVALVALLSFASGSLAMDVSLGKAPPSKKASFAKAYQLYQAKCTTCHEGVADPDKPGKTRDEWHIVIKLMHDLGLDLSEAEAETLVDYFFTIRTGTEKEAG